MPAASPPCAREGATAGNISSRSAAAATRDGRLRTALQLSTAAAAAAAVVSLIPPVELSMPAFLEQHPRGLEQNRKQHMCGQLMLVSCTNVLLVQHCCIECGFGFSM
jgi:hypothetical protein